MTNKDACFLEVLERGGVLACVEIKFRTPDAIARDFVPLRNIAWTS